MLTNQDLNQEIIQNWLSDLPIGEIQYFSQVSSTNDIALNWVNKGAKDFSLVIANEQTAGRGRGNRKWFTTANAAIAFSIILIPSQFPLSHLTRISALGSLAVCIALERLSSDLSVSMKWPNDVLINNKKTAGVLVEASWTANKPDYIVLGIGVNITPDAIPPTEMLQFPATCVNMELPREVNRLRILKDIIQQLLYWRDRLDTHDFIKAWQDHLAFKGQKVTVFHPHAQKQNKETTGILIGLTPEGFLKLQLANGKLFVLQDGDVHLRPLTAHENTLNL